MQRTFWARVSSASLLLNVSPSRMQFFNALWDLGRAAAVAKAHDVILVIENEYDCNVATGTETRRLFAALPDRTLMHNWDPGNCIEAGENPFPDAWNQLDHSRIAHMHLKDSSGHGWLPIGGGKIDFAGQFRRLSPKRTM